MTRLAALLLPLPALVGCAMDQNYTLESVHPLVSEGRRAGVAGCPDWSDGQANPSAGATGRNYGCAINANLAAMIADPADLVHGRVGNAGRDATTSVKAIKIWRDAVPSGDASLKKVIVQEAATGGGGNQ